jgi:DNA-binding transcriptional regulator YhcF (GntR family)
VKQAITFQLNQTSGIPAYLQIVQQVEQALRMGTLRPGDQLPTVKQVVAEVTINPNTVTKAYRELEHAGLAEGRQGVGTFVVGRPRAPSRGAGAARPRSAAMGRDGASGRPRRAGDGGDAALGLS